jgi:hypothetical protein
MRAKTLAVAVVVGAGLAATPIRSQVASTHESPPHAAHRTRSASPATDHQAAVDGRHARETGVAHTGSVHHFVLEPHGGVIRLEAADARDVGTRDRIRMHLSRLAAEFADGRFEMPMAIHDQVPPGVETLQRLKAEIRYRYAPTPRGGRVDITTERAEARAAIHAFLRFQIEEHRTGDPGDIAPPPSRRPSFGASPSMSPPPWGGGP